MTSRDLSQLLLLQEPMAKSQAQPPQASLTSQKEAKAKSSPLTKVILL